MPEIRAPQLRLRAHSAFPVVVVMVLAGCHLPSPSPGDASVDAGRADAGDAGMDAGPTDAGDAGVDAGPTDAGDAGVDAGPTDAGWGPDAPVCDPLTSLCVVRARLPAWPGLSPDFGYMQSHGFACSQNRGWDANSAEIAVGPDGVYVLSASYQVLCGPVVERVRWGSNS